MALFIKLRKNNDAKTPEAYGKWYARVAHCGTVSLRDLSLTMQQNCTLKRSDILAVLAELADTIKLELQNGNKVYIDGLGTFKMGIRSRGVTHPADYRTDHDVAGLHIVFTAESHRTRDGRLQHTLTTGTKIKTLSTKNRDHPFGR